MNTILAEILKTQKVSDGQETFPLHSHIDLDMGEIIATAITAVKPDKSIEIGFAYGISALYACDALSENHKAAKHIVIDPNQATQWHSIGLRNVRRAGYADMLSLIEEKSENALPRLLSEGLRVQVGIIDGWHTFDHALVDFFYVNKMLDIGGIVIFDDANYPSLLPLMRHVSTYPAYQKFRESQPPETHLIKPRTVIRRALAKRTGLSLFKRDWDETPPPRCVAFQKVAPDNRNWDWHAPF